MSLGQENHGEDGHDNGLDQLVQRGGKKEDTTKEVG